MTTPPRWPKLKAYREAVQAPSLCFVSEDLRRAVIAQDARGIPQMAAGRSAVVFKATVQARTVAIRCFTRASTDQERRYRALQTHVGSAQPPYLVGFAYRDDAICVGDGRYPLVEMDWVEGRPLDEWVRAHLGDGRHLIDQAASWLFMASDMLGRGLAHGDLANDNCLVTGSQMKLIDYDGCYVQSLADQHPGESGAAHFQHPHRDGYYGPDMDAFPTLVVFLSLLALHDNPSLWDRFHTDRNLIFRADDFLAPGQSPIWEALLEFQDPWIRALTAALAAMCRLPVDGLPSLPQVAARAGIRLSREYPWTLSHKDDEAWWHQPELTEGLRRHPPAVQRTGIAVGSRARQPTSPHWPPATTKPVPRASPPSRSARRSLTRRLQRHRTRSLMLVVVAVLFALLVIGLVV